MMDALWLGDAVVCKSLVRVKSAGMIEQLADGNSAAVGGVREKGGIACKTCKSEGWKVGILGKLSKVGVDLGEGSFGRLR